MRLRSNQFLLLWKYISDGIDGIPTKEGISKCLRHLQYIDVQAVFSTIHEEVGVCISRYDKKEMSTRFLNGGKISKLTGGEYFFRRYVSHLRIVVYS